MSKYTQADIEALQASNMFDADWYTERYPDVKALDIEPAEHYLRIGAKLGRHPSPLFNPGEYTVVNPDVAKAGIEPLLHYVLWGKSEGRRISLSGTKKQVTQLADKPISGSGKYHPDTPVKKLDQGEQFKHIVHATREKLDQESRKQYDVIAAEFDVNYYLNRNPDIARAFVASNLDPIKHYIDHGAREGRNPSVDFNTKFYVKRNRDVENSGIQPYYHYLTFGRCEGRQPLPSNSETNLMPLPSNSTSNILPYYGVVLHDLVEAARARAKPKGLSSEYDIIRSEFDIAYYFACNHDVAQAFEIDPVQHYIDYGTGEGRNPSPYFFTKDYIERYPEVEKSKLNPFHHWLTIGRDKGYIATPFKDFDAMSRILGKTPQETWELLSDRYHDLRNHLEHGKLGQMVAKAAELEPLVAHTWPEALNVKLPPFHSPPVVSKIIAMHSLHEAAGFKQAKMVIVVNKPRWGGTRRMEGHMAHALSEIYTPEEIVVLSTDQGGDMPPDKFPDGNRYIDFASIVDDLKAEARQSILVEFLRSLKPEAVFNINSRLLWDTLTPYGKALSASTSVYACYFCNEQTLFGHLTGYPAKMFYRHFDMLQGICTDSHYLAEWFKTRYMVPPSQRDRITVLEAPVDGRLSIVPANLLTLDGRRPNIFWSGRFDRQKRVDVVYALADSMPEANFSMWGEPVLDNSAANLKKPDNVIHEGIYRDFTDLPLDKCDLWLYTSEWDGVPSILLELSMTGVPVVGSLAGGTGEVLREDMSWPIADIEDIEAYKLAIEEVLSNPAAARERALRLREAMLAERTPDAYRKVLETLLQAGISS